MVRNLQRLIERQIQKAKLQGQLEGLEGEGKPLPDRSADAFVDAGEAVGFRIMAQAGVVPEEIELKKKMAAHQSHLATLANGPERKEAMAELARLELRYNIAREARQKFMRR
ncbi:DnaJ family domain-containing protein [Limimaricola variabilis]